MSEYLFESAVAPELGILNSEIEELGFAGFQGLTSRLDLGAGVYKTLAIYAGDLTGGEQASLSAAFAAHNPTDNNVNRRQVTLFDEFIGSQTGMGLGWAVSVFGAGSSLETPSGGARATGVLALKAAASVTSRVSYYLSPTALNFSAGELEGTWRVRLPNLATAIDDFDCFIGFGDEFSANEHVDGAYFVYDRGTSDNWICRTANNSVRTSVVTSVLVQADRWLEMKIVGNRKGTKVRFYINDVLVGTVSTNIPVDNDREFGPFLKIQKSAGAENRTIRADYFKMSQTLKSEV